MRNNDAGRTSPARRAGFLGLLVLMLEAGAAAAGGNPTTGAQFNFSTPGARSLAMGGAFIGLADDATAAYTNPAGLTNLTVGGSEAAVEFRAWDFSFVKPYRGHIGTTDDEGIDTVQGIEYQKTLDSESSLSFASVVYVAPHGLTLAAYRHQLAKTHQEAESQGIFYDEMTDDGLYTKRYSPSRSVEEISIENYGLSAARTIGLPRLRDSLAIGVGLSFYQFRYFARFDSFDRQDDFYGAANFLEDPLESRQVSEGDATDIGLNLGLLWHVGRRGEKVDAEEPSRVASDRKRGPWTLGAVYRQGPRFPIESRVFVGPRASVERFDLRSRGIVRVPDVFGAGVAYSTSAGKTKLTLDYNRVRYSQLFEAKVRAIPDELKPYLRQSDANNFHAGFERVFPIVEPQIIGTVRLGVWHESAHDLEFLGPEELRPLLGTGGEDDLHYSGGIGFVLGENFQVDAAIDLGRTVDTVSFSLVTFF